MLEKLFPGVSAFYKESGLSSSAAQTQKNVNTNEINLIKKKLFPKSYYNEKDSLFGGNDVKVSLSNINEKDLVKQEDFDALKRVAELHAENALLGQGIAYKESMRMFVQNLSNDVIGETFGIEKPTFTSKVPGQKSVFIKLYNGNVDEFCKIERIEDMYRVMSVELIELCKGFYKEAIKAEAIAASYGKVVADKDGFIRQIMTLDRSVLVKKSVDKGCYLKEEKILAYEPEAWKETETVLYEVYTNAQKQRNSFVKQIKDAARDLTLQYQEDYKAEIGEFQKLSSDFNNAINAFNASCEKIKTTLQKEIAALKI